MPRASLDLAEKLHETLGQTLLNALELGGTVTGTCRHCGELTSLAIPAAPQYISNAIKWLSDNGIDSIPVPGSATSQIKNKLPFPVVEKHEEPAPGEGGIRAKAVNDNVLPFPTRPKEAPKDE